MMMIMILVMMMWFWWWWCDLGFCETSLKFYVWLHLNTVFLTHRKRKAFETSRWRLLFATAVWLVPPMLDELMISGGWRCQAKSNRGVPDIRGSLRWKISLVFPFLTDLMKIKVEQQQPDSPMLAEQMRPAADDVAEQIKTWRKLFCSRFGLWYFPCRLSSYHGIRHQHHLVVLFSFCNKSLVGMFSSDRSSLRN